MGFNERPRRRQQSSKGKARPNEQGGGSGVTQKQPQSWKVPIVCFHYGKASHTEQFCPFFVKSKESKSRGKISNQKISTKRGTPWDKRLIAHTQGNPHSKTFVSIK